MGSDGKSETSTSSDSLDPKVKARLEKMASRMREAEERAEKAEARAERLEAEAGEDHTVLPGSRDIWRGHDSDRPQREDTIEVNEEAERAATPRRARVSEREVLEAAVARARGDEELTKPQPGGVR